MITFGKKALMEEYGLTEAQAKEIRESHFEALDIVRGKVNTQHERDKLTTAIVNMLPCLSELGSLRSVLATVQWAYRKEDQKRLSMMAEAFEETPPKQLESKPEPPKQPEPKPAAEPKEAAQNEA